MTTATTPPLSAVGPDGRLQLNFHPGQFALWQSRARIAIALAGVQAGKTELGPPWMAREIGSKGPGDYIVVGPTYKLLEKKVVPSFTRLFVQQCKWGKFAGGSSMTFRLNSYGERCLFGRPAGPNDPPTKVFFGHAQDPDSLASATAKGAWLDEPGQRKFKQGSWEELRARVAVNQGRILLTSRPYGNGWFKDLVDGCKVPGLPGPDGMPMGKYQPATPAPGTQSLAEAVPGLPLHLQAPPAVEYVRFESRMNPAFPTSEWADMERTLPRWKFDLLYRAIFTRPAGVIYDCYDSATHRVAPFAIPDNWPRYLGVDFGGVHTAAVYLASELSGNGHPSGRYYLYREYPPGGRYQSRPSWEHCRELRKGERVLVRQGGRGELGDYLLNGQGDYRTLTGTTADPAGTPWKRVVGGAKSEDRWRAEFAAAGVNVTEPPVSEVAVGIDRVYSLLKENRLFIFSTCVSVLEEMESYSRELDDSGEPLEAIEDKETFHLLDATRYVCSHLNGGKKELWLR